MTKALIEKYVKKYSFKTVWSEEDKFYIATCLEMPFLSADGSTIKDAMDSLSFIVKEALIWKREENEPFPEPISFKVNKG